MYCLREERLNLELTLFLNHSSPHRAHPLTSESVQPPFINYYDMTTKVTKHLSLTLLLLSIIPLQAQITLRGVVLDSTSRQGIALSSIVLHPLEGDTTANVATYTDLQGSYLITGLRSGTKYNVLIHARGYLDLEQTYTTPRRTARR